MMSHDPHFRPIDILAIVTNAYNMDVIGCHSADLPFFCAATQKIDLRTPSSERMINVASTRLFHCRSRSSRQPDPIQKSWDGPLVSVRAWVAAAVRADLSTD